MDTAYATAYADLYRNHWWWRTRETILLRKLADLIDRARPARILDVGCGAGLFFDALARFGHVEGIESDAALVAAEWTVARANPVGELDDSFRPENRSTRYSCWTFSSMCLTRNRCLVPPVAFSRQWPNLHHGPCFRVPMDVSRRFESSPEEIHGQNCATRFGRLGLSQKVSAICSSHWSYQSSSSVRSNVSRVELPTYHEYRALSSTPCSKLVSGRVCPFPIGFRLEPR